MWPYFQKAWSGVRLGESFGMLWNGGDPSAFRSCMFPVSIPRTLESGSLKYCSYMTLVCHCKCELLTSARLNDDDLYNAYGRPYPIILPVSKLNPRTIGGKVDLGKGRT